MRWIKKLFSESYLPWEEYKLLIENRNLWNFRTITALKSIDNFWKKEALKC